MQKMILQSKRRKVKMDMNYFVLAVFLLEPGLETAGEGHAPFAPE